MTVVLERNGFTHDAPCTATYDRESVAVSADHTGHKRAATERDLYDDLASGAAVDDISERCRSSLASESRQH